MNPTQPKKKEEKKVLLDLNTKYVNLDCDFFDPDKADRSRDYQLKTAFDTINKEVIDQLKASDWKSTTYRNKPIKPKYFDLLGKRRTVQTLSDEEFKQIYKGFMCKRVII